MFKVSGYEEVLICRAVRGHGRLDGVLHVLYSTTCTAVSYSSSAAAVHYSSAVGIASGSGVYTVSYEKLLLFRNPQQERVPQLSLYYLPLSRTLTTAVLVVCM